MKIITFLTTNYTKNYAVIVCDDTFYFRSRNRRWVFDPDGHLDKLIPYTSKLIIEI